MYAIIKNGQLINTGTLEAMFISNVFPPSGTPEWLVEQDVYEVVYPSYNPQLEQLVPQAPVVVGRQVTLHSVAPLPPTPEIALTEPLTEIIPNIQSADTVS